MIRGAAALAAGLALQGCIAAAVVAPVAAGATLGRKAIRGDRADAARDPRSREGKDDDVTFLPAGSALPAPDGSTPQPVRPAPLAVPGGMQYLYGSAEAAASSLQAWRALVRHVADKTLARPKDSVVLSADASLARPAWVPCGSKPPAAVFDVDETVILNLGFEYDAARGNDFSAERWAAWERSGGAQAVAVPGAAKALEALRTMGVTVVFNTNRTAANADATAALIAATGLGSAVHGETLFLSGDDDTGTHKDARRTKIAERYCVLAMAGDQMGDFSDLFNAGQGPALRRAEALSAAINGRWGAGWFLLPNPVYGPAMKGGFDDVFPQDMRWAPPVEATNPAPDPAAPPAAPAPETKE